MRKACLIKPRISLLLCLFFCVLYTLSFLLVALSSMPRWGHLLFDVFWVLHFLYVMRRYAFYRHPLSVTRLWCDENADWKMQCRNGQVRLATLWQSTVVSRYLVFLAFRVPGRFFPVMLPLALDSDDTENMRQLRRFIVSPSAHNDH